MVVTLCCSSPLSSGSTPVSTSCRPSNVSSSLWDGRKSSSSTDCISSNPPPLMFLTKSTILLISCWRHWVYLYTHWGQSFLSMHSCCLVSFSQRFFHNFFEWYSKCQILSNTGLHLILKPFPVHLKCVQNFVMCSRI